MPTRTPDAVDPDRLAARWLFELQQRVSQLADRTASAALTCWADELKAQLGQWATGEAAPLPHPSRTPPRLADPLDAWIAGRLFASARAPDAIVGLVELGWSSQAIANAHGDVSDSAVQDFVRRTHSVTFESHWKSPALIEAVQAAHDQGLTPRTIAVRIQSSRRPIEKLVGPLPGRRQRRLAKTEEPSEGVGSS